MICARTERAYRCGECGADPGAPCLWDENDPRPGVYHRDRELQFGRDVARLCGEISRLRESLAVYADPKHWAIRRNATMYADCIWIGPGATDRVNPDGPGVARAALREVARAALGVESEADDE